MNTKEALAAAIAAIPQVPENDAGDYYDNKRALAAGIRAILRDHGATMPDDVRRYAASMLSLADYVGD